MSQNARRATKRRYGTLLAAACALVAAACGDGGEAEGGETIRLTVDPTGIPALVAGDQDMFEGIDVEVKKVGFGEVEAALISGSSEVVWQSPIELAELVSQGEDYKYFSTAGAQTFTNGIVVRAEDADKYQSIPDIVGERLGIPGYGTGTWTSFQVVAQTLYGVEDPRNAFEQIVTADSAALLGLLETGEIDAALVFSSQSAAASALEQFAPVANFTEIWQEQTGQPLVINGAVATTEWLEANQDAANALIRGLDEAVAWMKENPQEFKEGGMYSDLAEEAGWSGDAETNESILQAVQDGKWLLTSETYTDEWIDASYQFIESGEDVFAEDIPERDEIFLAPDQLS